MTALARSRLRGNPYPALKDIACEYRAGTLTLRGRLPSFYLKQRAQEAVARIEGVERIDNRIEGVVPPDALPSSSRTTPGRWPP